VELLDEEGKLLTDKKSFEIFGNNLDRQICFEDGSDFSEFAGRSVRLRFTMCDAKIYSFRFS